MAHGTPSFDGFELLPLVAVTKRCSKCGEVKPVADFGSNKRSKGGHRPECKKCRCALEKARPKAHRASLQDGYRRNNRMVNKYGISLDQFEEMYAAQGKVCAICRRAETWVRRDRQQLCIDHDHASGLVRGLLCHYCNGLLGWARDDPEVLAAAIRYLRPESKTSS